MSAEISELKKIIEGAVLASAKPISYEKILGLYFVFGIGLLYFV